MVVTPEAIPATMPDDEPTAAKTMLDDHVPPPAAVSVTVLASHNEPGPLMAAGKGLTVTTMLVEQPVPKE